MPGVHMNSIVILALFYAFMTLFGIASLYLFLERQKLKKSKLTESPTKNHFDPMNLDPH